MNHRMDSSLTDILDCLNRGENPTPPDDSDGDYIVHGGLFNFGRFTINNGTALNNGTINSSIMMSAKPDQTLLRELADAQSILSASESLIADALGELREAIVRKDEKSIARMFNALSTGTAADVLKKTAGPTVLRFLGLA